MSPSADLPFGVVDTGTCIGQPVRLDRSWKNWVHEWRRDLVRLGLVMTVFTVGSACLAAFKVQDHIGGSWALNAVKASAIIGAMSLAVGAAICRWAYIEDRSPNSRPRNRR